MSTFPMINLCEKSVFVALNFLALNDNVLMKIFWIFSLLSISLTKCNYFIGVCKSSKCDEKITWDKL